MGKRKRGVKRRPKKVVKKTTRLPKTFACLFCSHQECVVVKLNYKASVGELNCRICGQDFHCPVNNLNETVDVYSAWVDACDTVAKEDLEKRPPAQA